MRTTLRLIKRRKRMGLFDMFRSPKPRTPAFMMTANTARSCKGRMEYDHYHYNHIGSYHCISGYHRMTLAYTVTDASLEEGWLVITKKTASRLHSPASIIFIIPQACCRDKLDSASADCPAPRDTR